MRKARAGPTCGHIGVIVWIWAVAGCLRHDRRIHVAIAGLDAGNFGYFPLLDVENCRDFFSRGCSCRSVVFYVGLIGGAPALASGHCFARSFYVAQSDWPALCLVRREK